MSSIKVFDLTSKQIVEEKVYGGGLVQSFYSNKILGFFIGQTWIQKLISKVVGAYKSSRRSKNQIEPFLKQYEMSLEGYQIPTGGFQSFSDFFVRKKTQINFPVDPNVFPSPCDARLSVSRIENGVPALKIKGRDVLLPDLLGPFKEKCPKSGWAMTFRLCPLDYHRYHFVDTGVVSKAHKLGTQLHSVNPWALQSLPKIFEWNERQVTFQQSEHYGELIYIEVGAMCVGKIHQTYQAGSSVSRGDEKGYFDFGGSTVVLIVGDDKKGLKINPLILSINKEGIEVLTRLGDNIGLWADIE